jgi:hypothetical protein
MQAKRNKPAAARRNPLRALCCSRVMVCGAFFGAGCPAGEKISHINGSSNVGEGLTREVKKTNPSTGLGFI